MDDALKTEIETIRSEMAEIRREYERMEAQSSPNPLREHVAGSEAFLCDFTMYLAQELNRQPDRIRIHRQLDAIEQRVAGLEARYGVNTAPN